MGLASIRVEMDATNWWIICCLIAWTNLHSMLSKTTSLCDARGVLLIRRNNSLWLRSLLVKLFTVNWLLQSCSKGWPQPQLILQINFFPLKVIWLLDLHWHYPLGRASIRVEIDAADWRMSCCLIARINLRWIFYVHTSLCEVVTLFVVDKHLLLRLARLNPHLIYHAHISLCKLIS